MSTRAACGRTRRASPSRGGLLCARPSRRRSSRRCATRAPTRVAHANRAHAARAERRVTRAMLAPADGGEVLRLGRLLRRAPARAAVGDVDGRRRAAPQRTRATRGARSRDARRAAAARSTRGGRWRRPRHPPRDRADRAPSPSTKRWRLATKARARLLERGATWRPRVLMSTALVSRALVVPRSASSLVPHGGPALEGEEGAAKPRRRGRRPWNPRASLAQGTEPGVVHFQPRVDLRRRIFVTGGWHLA